MTDGPFRLPAGGRVDRARPVRFFFDGQERTGLAGDTLASALLANGVRVVARSFKLHRPRGVFTAGSEEPSALVQVGLGAAATEPNLRATRVELYEGLAATSQNRWPSLAFDVGVVNDLLSPLLPAGFYYKTFIWPPLWHLAEPLIRRAAGLGQAPRAPDPDRYDRLHAHCDVLVVGAGPAGLAAALAAGRAGARVLLADEDPEPGGALLGNGDRVDGMAGADWAAAAAAELRAMDGVTVLSRATVSGYYDHNLLTVVERRHDHLSREHRPRGARQRLWKVRARRVVIAAGAHERPLPFRANDRPGVMLASAARTYVRRYGVGPGRRAVVATNNDSAYAAAFDLAAAGVGVAAVVDTRERVDEGLAAAARDRGIAVRTGAAVVASRGRRRVQGAEVMPLRSGPDTVVPCDLLCVSGGWNPAVHLFSQSGGSVRYDPDAVAFVPDRAVQPVAVTGAANGTFALAGCLEEGHAAGRDAAAAAGFRPRRRSRGPASDGGDPAPATDPRWRVAAAPGDRLDQTFVDLHNDVTAADVELAGREGYRSVEHFKRYTTSGMGPDQGKTGNTTAIALLARTLGTEISAVGTTTFRPPYTPVTFGTLAGRDVGALADPVRRTPMHRWHEDRGARFEDVAQWKRPWYYPAGGESMEDAVDRECLAVRERVGILDASTLGKIDIRGRDAARFLDRIYTNRFGTLGVGRCRYGLMCHEDGMVFDDGVTARLGEDHFYMTTTTGNAARVLAWLEEWLQTEWPELEVFCTSVTEQWAAAAVAGPLARELLAGLTRGVDLGPGAFPPMGVRDGKVAGIPARVFGVAFTGGEGFEVHVPARYGRSLWDALASAGAQHGLAPFGTEAMHVLRAERGFIIVGQETDGTVTPDDLGLGRMASKADDFLGKRSLAREACTDPDRAQLVGLLTVEPDTVLPEGGQILARPDATPPAPMIGHVTSSYRSAWLGRSVALALVAGGRRRFGDTVHVPVGPRGVAAKVTDSGFSELWAARDAAQEEAPEDG